MKVSTTEFKNHLGHYFENAITEPVIVENNGREVGVFLSFEDYERLQKLEDAIWATWALEAEQGGYVENGLEVLLEMGKEKGVSF
jgi:antitoxin Phd